MTHQVSKETLYHFLCSECSRWWSIGDWTPVGVLVCPHCGCTSEVVKIDDDDMVQNETLYILNHHMVDDYLKKCETRGEHP